MGFIIAIVFIWALRDVAKTAIAHARSDYKDGRKKAVSDGRKAAGGELPSSDARKIKRTHARGWWAREISGGLPHLRTGWHTGWLAHKTATDERRADREQARTEHLEGRASVLEQVRDHRRRQAEAQKQIDAILADDPDPGKPREQAQQAADELARKRSEKEQAGAVPLPAGGARPEPGPYAVRDDAAPDDSDWLRPGDIRCKDCGGTGRNKAGDDACPICRGWGTEADDPDSPLAPEGTICAACGNPGTEDDPVLDAGSSPVHRSHVIAQQQAYADRRAASANANGTAGGWPTGVPHRRTGDAPSPTGGTAVTTGTAETTYDQLMTESQNVINEAEAQVANLRASRISNMVEGMAGMVNDSNSLQRASEIDDAIREQIKAAQATVDAAQAFRDGLQREHGGMAEAHQNAPVAGAQPEFYEG